MTTRSITDRLCGLAFGGDYNPHQWGQSLWMEDDELMRRARGNSAHPDALTVRPDGTRLVHGSRDTYCLTAPAYRNAARRIAAVLAERYGDHPALAIDHGTDAMPLPEPAHDLLTGEVAHEIPPGGCAVLRGH